MGKISVWPFTLMVLYSEALDRNKPATLLRAWMPAGFVSLASPWSNSLERLAKLRLAAFEFTGNGVVLPGDDERDDEEDENEGGHHQDVGVRRPEVFTGLDTKPAPHGVRAFRPVAAS